jgi:Heterokaryon incompatibility protein (HET)
MQNNHKTHNSKRIPQSTTAMSAETFTYSPISGEEIRLLQISHATDGSISGILQTFRLDDPTCPKYAALSYVWGDEGHTWSITVNGKHFMVLQSLESFTHMLQRQDSRWKNTWWWIDSICINIEDLQERSVQVQRMRQIYRRADKTIVWLGEMSANSDAAMDFLVSLSRKRQQAAKAVSKDERLLSEKMKALGLNTEKYKSDWTAVNELFLRPWWTRVWTIQELILSPKVTFYCGSKNLSLSDLRSALYGLWLCSGSDSFPVSRAAFNATWNRRRLLQWFRNCEGQDSNRLSGISLTALMAYVSDNNATDPRDRIYSLLGLATDAEAIVQPNYNASTEDAYSEFVKSFIKKHQSLDVICFAQLFRGLDASSTSSLPSWVPDWRVKVDPTVVPLMVSQSARNHIGNLRPLKASGYSVMYSASGSRKPRVRFEAPGSIVCEGIFLDFVDGLSGCIPDADGCAPYPMVPPTSVINAPPVNQDDSKVGDANHLLVKICRSLVLDRKDVYLRHPSPTEEYLKDLQLFCSTAISCPSKVHPMFINWFSLNKSLKVQGSDIESLSKWAGESIPTSGVSLFEISDEESF